MKFTPKSNTGAIISGVLTVGMALLGIGHSARQTSADPSQASLEIQSSSEGWGIAGLQLTPAVYWSLTRGDRTAGTIHYQPVSKWYKSKSWWKRNAPIVGGAGGGALIGGLAGGGTGALIGGAVGGGGGYAYKKLKNRHYNEKYRNSNRVYQEHYPPPKYHAQ